MLMVIQAIRMMQALIIIIGILIAAGAILFFLLRRKIKQNRALKFEIERKDLQIERAAQNIKALTDYHRATDEIRKNRNDIINRIGKVKEGDDAEINDILRDIIANNNRRVQDGRTGRD